MLCLLFSCEKVNMLSDSVSLTDFKVLSHSPASIELGEPYIDADTVFIPVLRGISLFPLSISVEPSADGKTKQILTGSSFSSFSDIVFQSGGIDDKIFFLVAKSGLAKPYYIKLDISAQNTECSFKQLDIISSSVDGTLFPSQAYINSINKHVVIKAINFQFPISINTLATISDNAEIKGVEPLNQSSTPLNLSFSSLSDTIKYTIEAQSGKTEDWKVFLSPATPVTGSESADILAAVSIQQSALSAESQTPGYSILATKVDFNLGEILFSITPGTVFPELVIHSTIALPTNSYMLGYENGNTITFTSYSDTQTFYILDNRTGYYKSWTYKLVTGGVTDITKFVFTYDDTPSGSNQILLLNDADIDNIGKTITLYASKISPAHFPLIVTPIDVEVSSEATTNVGVMSFSSMDDVYTFKVSAGGIDENWTVVLKPEPTIRTEADIEAFVLESTSLPSLTASDINIYKDKAEVTIDIVDKGAAEVFNPKLQIKPIVTLSDGAEFIGYNAGTVIEFASFQETVTFTIQAENGTAKLWKVRLVNKPQLPNADFELWKADGLYPTIDPFPGIALGWATANNPYVTGTMPTSNAPNGNAAEMTTDIVNKFPVKNLITAGTLYVGQFKLSLDMGNPRSMTKFGIPFDAYPTAIKIDAKYQPGEKLQRSVGSGLTYSLQDVDGQDKGQIWVELVHWSGGGNIDYAGEPKSTVKVLARGEYNFNGASEWNRITIPFEKTANYDLYPVTHIVVVMASSAEGHLFLGAKGSKLTVDNIELVY